MDSPSPLPLLRLRSGRTLEIEKNNKGREKDMTSGPTYLEKKAAVTGYSFKESIKGQSWRNGTCEEDQDIPVRVKRKMSDTKIKASSERVPPGK